MESFGTVGTETTFLKFYVYEMNTKCVAKS